MTIVEPDYEGIIDKVLGFKDVPKDYPIIFGQYPKFKASGRVQAGINIARITGKYIWKYHKKKTIGFIGVSGGIIGLSTQSTESPSGQNGQARNNLVKSSAKRFRSRNIHQDGCGCTICR